MLAKIPIYKIMRHLKTEPEYKSKCIERICSEKDAKNKLSRYIKKSTLFKYYVSTSKPLRKEFLND